VDRVALEPFGGFGAVVQPAPLAHTIGVGRFGQEVTFQIAGRTVGAPLYQQLSARQIGGLASSPVALAPLFYAQELTGLEGRASRILVASVPGRESEVRAALERLAAGRLNVEPIGYDQTLFTSAATASNQSTVLFALISSLVGFLFAFNAMLLTVPQRRRLIADLRHEGYAPRTVIGVLLLDAVALGLLGCVLGLALGDELSIHVLHSDPAFLSLAFAIGSERIVTWQSVAIAVGGGMLAAIVAVLSPLRDVFAGKESPGRRKQRGPTLAAIDPSRARAGAGAGGGGGRAGRRRALTGVVCLGAATAILLAAPHAAIPGMVLLLASLLLVLPFMLSMTLTLVGALARTIVSAVPHVAVMELSAARARAVAIVATGAVAVFGSVAIQGAHGDLLSGLERASREMDSIANIWVAPTGAYDLLDTTSFAPTARSKLEHVPGVRAVRLDRSGLLDYGDRRVLILAPPRQSDPLLPASQIVRGNAVQVNERLRAGGWLVLSQALATEHHLHIGQTFTLPSPDPSVFRIAGISTNVGWAPGAIVMNAADYAHAWSGTDISAYNILLAPGVSPAEAVRAIEHALGPGSGLTVQSSEQHTSRQIALSREALARLHQIATLILLVAVLAMATAIGAMVWQRRPRLARLKLEGLPPTRLWHTILVESSILLATGCLTGAIYGLYGEQLADRALAQTINFPVVHSLMPLTALSSLALVIAAALAILAIPGYFAASVPAALALQD
jgi:putative ABC transport system permease protein